MADIKGYRPGTGDALDSTPDLKARQKAAQVDAETGEMVDLIDTDHHEIGTKAVPDLPMPDPRAELQKYPVNGCQPHSDAWKFADLLTVPSGPPPQRDHQIPADSNKIFGDNHSQNPDRRQYSSTQGTSYSGADPLNFFWVNGALSREIKQGTTWQSGPSDCNAASDHFFEQAGYWTAPGGEGMNWRNWPSGNTYEAACCKGVMKNKQLKMLFNAGHGTSTSSPEGMDHAVIGASGYFQADAFGVDTTVRVQNWTNVNYERRLPSLQSWIQKRNNYDHQMVGAFKAAHVYIMYRTDLTEKEWDDLNDIGEDIDKLEAAGIFEALASDDPFSILTNKKQKALLLESIPSVGNSMYPNVLRMIATTLANTRPRKLRSLNIDSMLRGLEQGKLQWMEVILWAWSVIGEQAPVKADPETGMVSNNHNSGGDSNNNRPGRPGGNNHPPFNHVQDAFDYVHSKNYPSCKGPPCQHYLGDNVGAPIDGKYPDGDAATWVRQMWEVWHKREHSTCDGKWAANGKGKWCIHQPGGGYHENWTGWDDLPDSMQETWWRKLHNPVNLGETCPGTWERNLHRFPESNGYCPHHPKYPGTQKPVVDLGEDYEWIKDNQVLAWLPEDPTDPNKGGHLTIQTHGGQVINITRDPNGDYLVNGRPPSDDDKAKWDDFWSGLGDQVHVGDGPNGPIQDGVEEIVSNIINNLNDWKDKTDNIEQKINLIAAIYNILTSKGEIEAIWEGIKAAINAIITLYGRVGSKHKTVDYICECKVRQKGDEGERVIIPRDWDTEKDDRWTANWFSFAHCPVFFNRTLTYDAIATVALMKLRFNGYLIDATTQWDKDEQNHQPGMIADTHSLRMYNWAPTYNCANFSTDADNLYFNRIPAEYPDPARRHPDHEDFYLNNPREAKSVVPMRRRPTAAAQEEWGKVCDEMVEIFRPDMAWVMRGKDQKWYPNMSGKLFQIGTQDVGASEVWRISGPTQNVAGVGYYSRNLYSELGFGMQCDVNYNSDNSSHQVVMDVMTSSPKSVDHLLKDDYLRIYMDLEAHNLNTMGKNANEHHLWQMCHIYANFVSKSTGARTSSQLYQHDQMGRSSPGGLGYVFRDINKHGTSYDEAKHLIGQCGTAEYKNLEDYIRINDPTKNANPIRKPLLLSCTVPDGYLLLGFTFTMWPGSTSLVGTKWHCMTIKRMRFLKADEDFHPAFWSPTNTLDHKKISYNWQRVKSSENEWFYNDKQQDLLDQLGEGLS